MGFADPPEARNDLAWVERASRAPWRLVRCRISHVSELVLARSSSALRSATVSCCSNACWLRAAIEGNRRASGEYQRRGS